MVLSQRKNGLFKKAYELGVLCSCDVAVIVFEERTTGFNPNGPIKLHQYSSTDIRRILSHHAKVRLSSVS